MLNSGIWLSIAIIIFLIVAVPISKDKALNYLEKQRYKIKNRVEEARSLLQKSRNVLGAQKRKNKQLEQEQDKILHEARKTSETIKETESKNIDNECEREYQNALRNLQHYKESKITEMHHLFARRTFELVREYLKQNPESDINLKVIESEIKGRTKK
jgi:F0F1-type ATP synthase membrane subunit b/b'